MFVFAKHLDFQNSRAKLPIGSPLFFWHKKKTQASIVYCFATNAGEFFEPFNIYKNRFFLIQFFHWDSRTRTYECQNQNLKPYHLAISHVYFFISNKISVFYISFLFLKMLSTKAANPLWFISFYSYMNKELKFFGTKQNYKEIYLRVYW